VYAVDVNTDQLAWKLRGDERVKRLQKNARELSGRDLPEPVELVVADVSFISVNKVLPGAVECTKPGAELLILIKPQFELKREDIGKGGIVKDSSLHERAIDSVKNAAGSLGLECLGVKPSRLAGAEGNQEYFLHARKVAGVESR
jgi:23S rRNA (cytidine1920-2'-O)/16S rRNA (cytidine1409-2'-O)-methyltransferase